MISDQSTGLGLTIWVMISAIIPTTMKEERFGLDALSCLTQMK